ncbi:MAG: NAD(+) synthase, partial [Spirochaetota bacterium]|nr:NAD(+) synthase [Spirochaetota bacterium]
NIPASTCSAEENIYNALVLGKRDYHKKCSIQKSVIGVSGGIDSATVLAIDVAALSKENVLAIISPSRYTSEGTLSDAIKLCQNFEVEFLIIPIEEKSPSGEWIGAIPEKNKRFIKYFGKPHKEIVFENQQAIDRMSILRSIANEDNRLISGTGNKTELATGYATVCGDLQADILVIGDLYKHQVFSLAKHINKFYNKEMIPETIINRIPSAELSENQVDPFDYTRIDELVRLKIEEYVPDSEIVNYSPKNQSPFTEEEIKRISSLIDINEHKRFKSGYILKISRIAFGEDRRVNTAKKINLF